MKFMCPLIVVNDISVSKSFYEKVLGQKVKYDIGANVAFEGDFALQAQYAELVGLNQKDIVQKSNNFELYFEEEDIEGFANRLKSIDGIEYVHDIKEYPWGQRVIRLYDPDKHIIEVGESMVTVVKRFLSQGLSVEETAKLTMYPVEFIQQYV